MNEKEQVGHYWPFLRGLLTPARFQHSLGVTRVMAELTPIYSLDPEQALTSGILHDVAKDLSNEHQLLLAEKARIEIRHPCEQHPVYLHALVGAYLVASELGITDRLILDAIATHSYAGNGAYFDAPLSRCLRLADILSPFHEWRGMKKLKRVVFKGHMDEAVLLQCNWLIEYYHEHQIPVHPNLSNQHQALKRELAVTESFFERW